MSDAHYNVNVFWFNDLAKQGNTFCQGLLITLIEFILQEMVLTLAVHPVGTKPTKRVSYSFSSKYHTLQSGVTRGQYVTGWVQTLLW